MSTPPTGHAGQAYVPNRIPSQLNYPQVYKDPAGLIVRELAQQPFLPATRDLCALQATNHGWHGFINSDGSSIFWGKIYKELAPLLSSIRSLWKPIRMSPFEVTPYLSPAKSNIVRKHGFGVNRSDTSHGLAERAENPRLTSAEWTEFVTHADNLTDVFKKANALADLAEKHHLTAEQGGEILVRASNIGNEGAQARILASVSRNPDLASFDLAEIFNQVSGMEEPFGDSQTVVLSSLAQNPGLMAEDREEILKQASRFDDVNQSRILSGLAQNPALPIVEREAIFTGIDSWPNDQHKSVILSGLAKNPALSKEERAAIVHRAKALSGDYSAAVLVSLAERYPWKQ